MARTKIERSIDIDVSATTAYDQWANFEEFPNFMDGVDAVEQLDDRRLHWRAHVGPRKCEWDAEIVELRPDALIAWRSTSGVESSGVVTFAALGTHRTRVQLTLEYAPEGFFQLQGDALGAVARRVEGDLERFKALIETQGTASGAWHGVLGAGSLSRAGDDKGPSPEPPEATEGAIPVAGPPQPPPSTYTLRAGQAPLGRTAPASGPDAHAPPLHPGLVSI